MASARYKILSLLILLTLLPVWQVQAASPHGDFVPLAAGTRSLRQEDSSFPFRDAEPVFSFSLELVRCTGEFQQRRSPLRHQGRWWKPEFLRDSQSFDCVTRMFRQKNRLFRSAFGGLSTRLRAFPVRAGPRFCRILF